MKTHLTTKLTKRLAKATKDFLSRPHGSSSSFLSNVLAAEVCEQVFEFVRLLVSLRLDADEYAARAQAGVVDLRPVLGDARAYERADKPARRAAGERR